MDATRKAIRSILNERAPSRIRFYFHGTLANYIGSILEDGLSPRFAGATYSSGPQKTMGGSYLSPRPDKAAFTADELFTQMGSRTNWAPGMVIIDPEGIDLYLDEDEILTAITQITTGHGSAHTMKSRLQEWIESQNLPREVTQRVLQMLDTQGFKLIKDWEFRKEIVDLLWPHMQPTAMDSVRSFEPIPPSNIIGAMYWEVHATNPDSAHIKLFDLLDSITPDVRSKIAESVLDAEIQTGGPVQGEEVIMSWEAGSVESWMFDRPESE